MRALIVEDDTKIASLLTNRFGEAGFVVDAAHDEMRDLVTCSPKLERFEGEFSDWLATTKMEDQPPPLTPARRPVPEP